MQAGHHDVINWMQFYKRKVAGMVKTDHKWRNNDYGKGTACTVF